MTTMYLLHYLKSYLIWNLEFGIWNIGYLVFGIQAVFRSVLANNMHAYHDDTKIYEDDDDVRAMIVGGLCPSVRFPISRSL